MNPYFNTQAECDKWYGLNQEDEDVQNDNLKTEGDL